MVIGVTAPQPNQNNSVERKQFSEVMSTQAT